MAKMETLFWTLSTVRGGIIISHPAVPVQTKRMWDMLNLPQGQRPVEVRAVRGSPSGEISQMDAQPILPPEREGPLTLAPDSLIIADDHVHSSSRSTHCLSCRNPTMPGLPYCEYCGNAKVKELPENHQSKVEAISQSHMSRGLRWVTTVSQTSGPRSRMSSAQMRATGRELKSIDKHCKNQRDRCTKKMISQNEDRLYESCADRWDHSPRLRQSMRDARKDRAQATTERSGADPGNRMQGWSNSVLATEDWEDILVSYGVLQHAIETRMTEAQFVDWVACAREDRFTRTITCSRTGKTRVVNVGLLPQPWRAENLPRSRIAQHGEGPSSATVLHPSFEELSSQNRQQGAPGGLASMVERPEKDEEGELMHPRWQPRGASARGTSTASSHPKGMAREQSQAASSTGKRSVPASARSASAEQMPAPPPPKRGTPRAKLSPAASVASLPSDKSEWINPAMVSRMVPKMPPLHKPHAPMPRREPPRPPASEPEDDAPMPPPSEPSSRRSSRASSRSSGGRPAELRPAAAIQRACPSSDLRQSPEREAAAQERYHAQRKRSRQQQGWQSGSESSWSWSQGGKSRGKGEGKGQWHWNQWSGTWNYQGGSSSWGDDEMQSMSNWSASNW